jgi:hypothetical protein
METIESVWQFIVSHFWKLILAIMVFFKGGLLFNKLFLEPITGEDGTVAMDELAKYVLIVVFVMMVIMEGRDEKTLYDVAIFYAIVLAVVSIAGIHEASKVLGKYFDNKNK